VIVTTEGEVDDRCSMIRFLLYADQWDIYGLIHSTFKTYLRPAWPGIQILRSGGPSFGAIAYGWQQMQSPETQSYFDRDWMTTNILEGHGPLCQMYEAQEGSFRSEGDSPAFLHLINTGLRSSEHPSFGGWGGRFAFSHGVWKSVDKKEASPHSILRWAAAFQNDWAARADWCVASLAEANHPPHVVLTGGVDRMARAGDRVELNAQPSHDPDGDPLAFQWWHDAAASTYAGPLDIDQEKRPAATIAVPRSAQAGDTIHVVCQVNDQQTPPLTRYQRVVITVSP
jgi:hypothetical protein